MTNVINVAIQSTILHKRVREHNIKNCDFARTRHTCLTRPRTLTPHSKRDIINKSLMPRRTRDTMRKHDTQHNGMHATRIKCQARFW